MLRADRRERHGGDAGRHLIRFRLGLQAQTRGEDALTASRRPTRVQGSNGWRPTGVIDRAESLDGRRRHSAVRQVASRRESRKDPSTYHVYAQSRRPQLRSAPVTNASTTGVRWFELKVMNSPRDDERPEPIRERTRPQRRFVAAMVPLAANPGDRPPKPSPTATVLHSNCARPALRLC